MTWTAKLIAVIDGAGEDSFSIEYSDGLAVFSRSYIVSMASDSIISGAAKNTLDMLNSKTSSPKRSIKVGQQIESFIPEQSKPEPTAPDVQARVLFLKNNTTFRSLQNAAALGCIKKDDPRIAAAHDALIASWSEDYMEYLT